MVSRTGTDSFTLRSVTVVRATSVVEGTRVLLRTRLTVTRKCVMRVTRALNDVIDGRASVFATTIVGAARAAEVFTGEGGGARAGVRADDGTADRDLDAQVDFHVTLIGGTRE